MIHPEISTRIYQKIHTTKNSPFILPAAYSCFPCGTSLGSSAAFSLSVNARHTINGNSQSQCLPLENEAAEIRPDEDADYEISVVIHGEPNSELVVRNRYAQDLVHFGTAWETYSIIK